MNHSFQPIDSQTKLQAALEYVVEQSLALAKTVTGRELNIDTICFFAQSMTEYDFLANAIRARGPESDVSHEPTLYVDSDFQVNSQHIRYFGVRRPDPSRPEVGYGDYPIDDYAAIRDAGGSHITEIISGRGKKLLELRHPDFDVRGYIVDKAEHVA